MPSSSKNGRIKCLICNKQLLSANFSQAQINRAKTRTSYGIATCNGCLLGTRNQEIKCAWCSQWKSIDEFSGAQRRDRDNARCKDCALERDYMPIPHISVQEEREKTLQEPDYDDDDDDDDDASEMQTNVYDDSTSVCVIMLSADSTPI
jgi:hypothetical protein